MIAASSSLYTNYLLLRNIKGIGIINAIVLLCITDNFQRFDNPRKFACYCGGAPFEHTSGISIWGKTQTSSLALYEGQKKRNNPGILLSVLTINKRSAIAYYHCFPDWICLIWTVYINVRWMLHLICWLYPVLIIYVNGEVFYKKFIKHICFMIIIVYLHRKLKIIFNKTRKLSSFTWLLKEKRN